MNSFYLRWQDKGSELNDTQSFWLELLHDIIGIADPTQYIEFEKRVELAHMSFIDAYIPSTKIIIEQKSYDISLDKPQPQSDGSIITPFEQAKRYYDWLPASQRGRYIIISNFRELRIHDMETPKAPPRIIPLSEIEHSNLSFIVRPERELTREEVISLEAGRLVRKFYSTIKPKYTRSDKDSLRSLNVLCVRLVFLLYAEDSGLFSKSQFHDFMASHTNTARTSLIDLFKVLDTPDNQRDPYLDDDLAAFPYVNGGLFSEQNIEIPKLNDEILHIIISEMSEGFDWSEINPTIFGALFESTLNPDTRTEGGMHYTSIQNIHRVIDALFLDELTQELKDSGTSKKALLALQDKLASLTFLDPACGSGNFLTETYLSLRRLENKIIEILSHGQINFAQGEFSPIKVSIAQFFGIEVNDFAVAVARTALWIAEHQMMRQTRKIVAIHDDFIPLKTEAKILEANAIQTDWEELISRHKLSYIMGNPPYRGARIMKQSQKDDIKDMFKGWGKLGDLDYVCCWYKKACDFMKGTSIHAALVSTNSINQGDTVSMFWKPLIDEGMSINFAWRSFIWDNEASEKAHVHCVIIGFSYGTDSNVKTLYIPEEGGEFRKLRAGHINAYLIDAPDWYIFNRTTPLSDDIPPMRTGNKPIDNGEYLFTQEEYHEFIKREPKSKQYFHLWYGGQEFLYDTPRMCLYLGNCTPHQIKMMPLCMRRVEAVRQYRLASKSMPTRKLADTPTRFHIETFPKGNYIVVPQVSSEGRQYIPMGFLDEKVMCSSQLKVIPNATLYHFGVLESLIHMAWMRVVAGRLGMSYRYSNTLVYNCFPWANRHCACVDCSGDEHVEHITQTARGILEARAMYPDSNLAELYSETLMPAELRKAHRENDEAVRCAYGFPKDWGELEIVGRLMELYNAAVREEVRRE